MALLDYFKAQPTEYILAYANGHIFRQGEGQAFWYWSPNTSIALIPIATTDSLFVFNEASGNFQAITVQGQITYRITEPQLLATLLNFTINPQNRQYQSNDPEKLNQRIINIIQRHTRRELQQLSLEDALRSSAQLAETVFANIQQEPALRAMGIQCISLFFTSIKATPEMSKALEAEYREALQKRADQAIYSRRADAVEQERKIKQNELSTLVDLEERRQQLVNLEGENARKQAEFAAEALRIQLTPYQNFDTRLLLALAFRDFAENSHKIGNLTITSEILERLLNP
jgi:hypothetical protein